MKISTIIPTRNRKDTLKRLLDSLLSDDYQNKEIIVVDGASTDGTVELLRSYGDWIQWISEPDEGEFDARNKAIRLSTGDIIRNVSDDDVHVTGSFAFAARYFEENPEIDMIFGQALIFYEEQGGTLTLLDGRRRTSKSITLRNFICGYAPLVVSEAVFFRRRVIDKIGYFENVRGGDYEYWARAAKAGLKLAVVDRVFVEYRRSEANENLLNWAYRDLVLAQKLLARRYGSWLDRLYVNLVRIPFRLFVLQLYGVLPRSLTLRLRKVRWRLLNRKRSNLVLNRKG
jgi:glycosyltransferase involved in cell wall biosynthesis